MQTSTGFAAARKAAPRTAILLAIIFGLAAAVIVAVAVEADFMIASRWSVR